MKNAIILFLVIVIIMMFIIIKYDSTLYGILIVDDIDYSKLNHKIKKCYVANCFTSFGEKLNILTRSVSHHVLVIYTEHDKFIISRIKNFVQVILVKEDFGDYVVGTDDYKYYLLESFSLLGLSVSDVIKYGEEICQKYQYSLFNHNCQEFVYDIMRHYKVISENDVNKYEGKMNLFLKGMSEVINN